MTVTTAGRTGWVLESVLNARPHSKKAPRRLDASNGHRHCVPPVEKHRRAKTTVSLGQRCFFKRERDQKKRKRGRGHGLVFAIVVTDVLPFDVAVRHQRHFAAKDAFMRRLHLDSFVQLSLQKEEARARLSILTPPEVRPSKCSLGWRSTWVSPVLNTVARTATGEAFAAHVGKSVSFGSSGDP